MTFGVQCAYPCILWSKRMHTSFVALLCVQYSLNIQVAMDEVKSLLEIGQTMSFNLAWYGMACTKSPQRISFPHTHAQNVARTDSWKAILVHLFDIQNTKRFELNEIDNIDRNMADRCSLLFSSVRQFFSLFGRPTEKKTKIWKYKEKWIIIWVKEINCSLKCGWSFSLSWCLCYRIVK